MAANTVGTVRRTDRPDAVILHVDRSGRALWAAMRLFGVLLVALGTIALALYLTDGAFTVRRGTSDATWVSAWSVGGILLLWWHVGRNIPPLLRTARQRVTIEINAQRQRLAIETGGGGDEAARRSWPTSAIEDVLISPRGGDAGEVRIVPSVGRTATLFYGLRQDELEFIVATMRDSLRLTARDADALEVDAPAEPLPADQADPGASAEHRLALDYAPALPAGVAIDRGQSGVTIGVAPVPVTAYLAERWPLIALLLAIIVVWGLATDTKRGVVLVGVPLALLFALANAAACLTHTTIQLGRTRLSRLTATPFKTIDEGWAVRSIRDVIVIPRPPTVELRLAGGETATLANPATADEAEAIAAALRRALRTYTRERAAAAAAAPCVTAL